MKKRNDDIERICAYYENAVVIKDSNLCICRINGAVGANDTCKKFTLDLLKLDPRTRVLPDEDTVFFEF